MNKPSPITLRPPWVHLARLAWLVMAAACLTLFTLSTLETLRTPLPSCTASEATCLTIIISREDAELAAALGWPPLLPLAFASSLIARLSLAVVGLLIFWRKSEDWLALMMSGALLAVLLEGAHFSNEALTPLLSVLFGIGTALFIPLPFIFPSGRFEPGWVRWPAIPLTLIYTVVVTAFIATPYYASTAAALTILWAVLSAYAMSYRYFRVSNAVERQQIKWVLLGIAATFIVGIYYSTFTALYPTSQPSVERVIGLMINGLLYPVCYGFFAFSFIVAILRYRLWDIDLIIRRTLQYSVLSGLLGLTYFGLVIILQNLLSVVNSQPSEFVTVLSTLAIAALFFPLRNRVQEFIDKRFYRKKYDAQKVIADFAATCRDETDLDKLVARLEEVIDETLQPEKVSVWIKDNSALKR